MLIAISAAFILPDLPTNTRGFTKEELELAQLRMAEDVGEADVDSEDQGPLDGLFMAVKDIKIYIMMLTFTAYVVGLSFNAFFVSSSPSLLFTLALTREILAEPYGNPRVQLCADSAHERPAMGIFLYLFADCCLELRSVSGEGSSAPATSSITYQSPLWLTRDSAPSSGILSVPLSSAWSDSSSAWPL